MLYASQADLKYAVPEPKYKQASLRNSTRSLKERRVEPLGNLNKFLPCAQRVAHPLMHHMRAQVCTRTAISYFHLSSFSTIHFSITNSTRGWPLLGLLTLPTARERSKWRRKRKTSEAPVYARVCMF